MASPKVVERDVDELGGRLRVADLVEPPHPLLVGHALGLEAGDQLVLGPVDLAAQDDGRVLEHRLDDAQKVECVEIGFGVEPADRVDQEQRQVVEQREVDLQLVVHDRPSRR